jgi:acyl-CoA synthetase (AMP-forming)/AMP-acid ligase II
LYDFLDYQARERAEAEFAIQGNRRITYGEALAETNRLANTFIDAGLQIGDRIAILSKNSIEYILLYFAAAKAGVVPVPLNYRLAPAEWHYILSDAGVKLLIVAGEYLQAIDSIRDRLATADLFVAMNGPATTGWHDYRGWVAGQPAASPDHLITPDHDLYQMYTSGTTGRPKGAILSHRAVTAHLTQIALAHDIRPGERVLLVAPVFHVAGANVAAFVSVYVGGCLYIQADFKPDEVVRALSEEEIGLAVFVPAMIQSCLTKVPDVAQRSYHSLRLIHYGASPIAEQTLRRAMDIFQCDFSQGYGMTEMTAAITYLSPADHRRALAEKPDLLLAAGGVEQRAPTARRGPRAARLHGCTAARLHGGHDGHSGCGNRQLSGCPEQSGEQLLVFGGELALVHQFVGLG